jgi:dolichol-phosphate mannosyltransferase
MPSYNEQGMIAPVVTSWASELDRLGIDYELRVYDDGSKDRTGEILEALAATLSRLVAVRQTNRGHGATVLRGYDEARGAWVFQVDSDGELSPGDFECLWSKRESYDFLVGTRTDRHAPIGRRVITGVSRVMVWTFFGRGVTDVNAPYRLMRRAALEPLLGGARGTFAPNVILSGLAVRSRLRILEQPVQYEPRKVGQGSLGGWKLWRSAARSLRETLTAGLTCWPRRWQP